MGTDKGWLKVHRCLLDKPIWANSTPEQKTILISLLLMANHAKKSWEWRGLKYDILPGQMVTSAKSICEKAGKGISRQNVRSSLNRFEKLNFLTFESTKRGMLISILNWDSYQSTQPSAQPSAQPRPNQGPTTNKNERIKEDKKPSSKKGFEGSEQTKVYKTKKGRTLSCKRLLAFNQFWEAFGYKSGKADAADAWLDIPPMTDSLVKLICDAATVENSMREKLKADGKTPKMAQGWISGRRWEDEIYQAKVNGDNPPPINPEEQQQKYEDIFR